MARAFIVPVRNTKVRLPNNPRQYLPEEGMEVELDQYWARRLADGDIKISEPAQPE